MRATALFTLATLVTTGWSIPYGPEGVRQPAPVQPLIPPELPTQILIQEAMMGGEMCAITCMVGIVNFKNFFNLPRLFEDCAKSTKCGGGMPPGSGSIATGATSASAAAAGAAASVAGRRQKVKGQQRAGSPIHQVSLHMQNVLDQHHNRLEQIMSSMGPAGPVIASVVVVALVAAAFPAIAGALGTVAGLMRLGWVVRAAPMLVAA